MHDTYNTIEGHFQAEITVKHSRFIADAVPTGSVEEALAEIQTIQKREYNASHHCTAYRIGHDGEEFRYNDDGEPSRTAGPPILAQIEGRELTNILVVVTRYYGGTNLGTGGLIRAYGDAASLALDAAPIKQRILRDRLSLRFNYDDTSPAMHTISQFNATIVDTHYTEDTKLIVNVRQSETDALIQMFTNALGGRGIAKLLNATSDIGNKRI